MLIGIDIIIIFLLLLDTLDIHKLFSQRIQQLTNLSSLSFI